MNMTPAEHRRGMSSFIAGRGGIWLFALIAIAVVGLLVVRLTKVMGAGAQVDAANKPVPTVSVTEVGISKVPTTVSIIGTVSARYDMPIGVEDNAGRVSQILVEAGDHVKKGQILARLKVSVLEPEVANLEAALEQ